MYIYVYKKWRAMHSRHKTSSVYARMPMCIDQSLFHSISSEKATEKRLDIKVDLDANAASIRQKHLVIDIRKEIYAHTY